MKKFKTTVTKTFEYEIEIDESVWTDEEIKNWSSIFYNADSLEDVVETLATMKTEYANGEFIEGFGIPYINGKAPYVRKEYEKSLSPDINIMPKEQVTWVDVEEVKS